MKKINRILAYGCSYTAGDEIMDHITMGVSFEECNRIKKTYRTNVGRGHDIKTFREDFNILKDNPLQIWDSWASMLAKKLSVSFENRAVNGSSLDEHYFKIYNDYISGKIKETDLVLVGLTSMDRMIDFRATRPMPHNNSLVSSLIPNDEGSRLLVELRNDDFLVFHYFKNIHLLHYLGSKINLMMQPMRKIWTMPFINNLDVPYTRQYANSVWNECTENILSELYLDFTIPLCGFGHPPLESHILLADQLEKLVSDKFQLL